MVTKKKLLQRLIEIEDRLKALEDKPIEQPKVTSKQMLDEWLNGKKD